MATNGIASAITSTPVTPTTSSTASSTSSTGIDSSTLAGNFQTFLTLLTTQLQNQNPLDPLDTNQFTQQLVQFAQVEQQLKSNDELSSLVAMQKTAQATQALTFVGATVAVDGTKTALANGGATWGFTPAQAGTATITITDSTGQTAYSGSYDVKAGNQSFTWDGKGNSGTTWPDGNYTMNVTMPGTDGNPVSVATEIYGVVNSIDLTQTPPILSISGQNFTVDKIKRVAAPAAAQTSNSNSSVNTSA